MSETIITTIISAFIAGLFTLVSKRMELTHSARSISAPQTVDSLPQSRIENHKLNTALMPTNSVNLGTAIRHVGILQLCLNLVGLLVGVTLGLAGSDENILIAAILLVGTIVLAIGFWISGSLVNRSIRWTHLVYVAIGTLITTLFLNSLLLQQPLTGQILIVGMMQTFGTMVIVGVVLNALKRD